MGTKSDKVFENGMAFEEENKDEMFDQYLMKDKNNLNIFSGETIHTEISEEDSHDINFIARMYAKRKGFLKFYDTSALFGSNVKTVFDEAIEQTY